MHRRNNRGSNAFARPGRAAHPGLTPTQRRNLRATYRARVLGFDVLLAVEAAS